MSYRESRTIIYMQILQADFYIFRLKLVKRIW